MSDVDLAQAKVPPEFLERIPLRFARENGVVAVGRKENGVYLLALGNKDRLWAADRVAYKLGRRSEVVLADEGEVLKLINHAYHAEAKEIAEVAEELSPDIETGEVVLAEDVLELDEKAPAVKLVHAMLLQAIRQRASDIHLEPSEGSLRIRFRIDGVLYERVSLPREIQEGITSRIKVMGRLDIAERRLPQDGGVTVRVGERRIDLRIATLPSQYGERVVLRLLDKSTGLLALGHLGWTGAQLATVRRILRLSHGIVLVTGPTGSGKTTTLYAMLSELNSAELNILTLEDPVEYQLPGITQTQVSEKKGLTFAKGLRSLVRQDPDIIMVGEIRDLETATIAIQSSLTGHLVFSTLHTNDAPSSVTRILDLGVEPYLVASSVVAILAQRLVRTVCPACKETVPLDLEAVRAAGWSEEDLSSLGETEGLGVARGKGCPSCFGTGFSGRVAIFEILSMTDEVRDLVQRRAPASEIRRAAVAQGFFTLRRSGLVLIKAGATTLEEVWSVTQTDLG
jgi:general secretion pathway protein E